MFLLTRHGLQVLEITIISTASLLTARVGPLLGNAGSFLRNNVSPVYSRDGHNGCGHDNFEMRAVSRNSPNPNNYGNSGSSGYVVEGLTRRKKRRSTLWWIYVIFTLINTIMLTLIVTATGTQQPRGKGKPWKPMGQ